MEAAGTHSASLLQWAFHPCIKPAPTCSYNTTWLKLLFQPSFYQKRHPLCVFWMLWFTLQRGLEVRRTSIWFASKAPSDLIFFTPAAGAERVRQHNCTSPSPLGVTKAGFSKTSRAKQFQNKNVTWSYTQRAEVLFSLAQYWCLSSGNSTLN